MDLVSPLRLGLVIDLNNIMESIPLNLKVFHREHVIRDRSHLPLHHFRTNGLSHLSHALGSVSAFRRGSSTRCSILNQLIDSHSKVASG